MWFASKEKAENPLTKLESENVKLKQRIAVIEFALLNLRTSDCSHVHNIGIKNCLSCGKATTGGGGFFGEKKRSFAECSINGFMPENPACYKCESWKPKP